MTYRIEITAETLTELAGKALSLASQLNLAAVAPEPTAAPVAAAPATKAKAKPAPAPEPVAEVVAEPAAPEVVEVIEAEVVEPSGIDYHRDIAPNVIAVVTRCGKPVMAEILAGFGAAKASHVPEAQWPELLDALNGALAGA